MDGASKTVAFLHQASKAIPNTPQYNALRCNLIKKCYVYESRKEVHLPAQHFGPNVICNGCGINFHSVPPRVAVESERKMNKSAKKLLKKKYTLKNLTKKQNKYLEKMHSTHSQKMVTMCKLCKKKNKMNILRPVKFKEVKQIIRGPRPKKKKKSDKFAGLNKSVILVNKPKADSTPVRTVLNDANQNTIVANTIKDVNPVNKMQDLQKECFLSKKAKKDLIPKTLPKTVVAKGKVTKHPKKKKNKKQEPKVLNMITNILQNDKGKNKSMLQDFLKVFN